MMHRYFNQGFYDKEVCHGLGYFNGGWGIVIGIGLLITLALLIYLLANNKKKRISSEALESLKLQYVKGEISEEEYFRRKKLLQD